MGISLLWNSWCSPRRADISSVMERAHYQDRVFVQHGKGPDRGFSTQYLFSLGDILAGCHFLIHKRTEVCSCNTTQSNVLHLHWVPPSAPRIFALWLYRNEGLCSVSTPYWYKVSSIKHLKCHLHLLFLNQVGLAGLTSSYPSGSRP